MASYLAKGLAIWILGFLTFLAGLNALNAVVQWSIAKSVVKPYIIGDLIGEIQVSTYFWTSTIITFIFLGLTSIVSFSRPPSESLILGKISGVEEEIVSNRSMLESTQIGLYQRLENNQRARAELSSRVNAILNEFREEMVDVIDKQREEIQAVRDELERLEKELFSKSWITNQSHSKETGASTKR